MSAVPNTSRRNMASKTLEKCPTCAVTFTASPARINGKGSWMKVCPNGHASSLNKLAKVRGSITHEKRAEARKRVGAFGMDLDDGARCALAAMVAGYDQLISTTPERSHPVIEGAFGRSVDMARLILGAV